LLAGYGEESTRDLSDKDLVHLSNRLANIKKTRNIDRDEGLRKGRSTILTILQEMGIYKGNHDWAKVNLYLKDPRISGKLLYEMNIAELDNLRVKLNSILSKNKKVVKKEQYLAELN